MLPTSFLVVIISMSTSQTITAKPIQPSSQPTRTGTGNNHQRAIFCSFRPEECSLYKSSPLPQRGGLLLSYENLRQGIPVAVPTYDKGEGKEDTAPFRSQRISIGVPGSLSFPTHGDGSQAVMKVDGVPLSILPPRFLLLALLRETEGERWRRRDGDPRRHGERDTGRRGDRDTGRQGERVSSHEQPLPRVGGTVTTQDPADSLGLDATAFCSTAECVRMMQDYEKWRQQNGFGLAGGRWG